jgi:hypothetical protein
LISRTTVRFLGGGALLLQGAGTAIGLFGLVADPPVLRLGQGFELLTGRADHEIAFSVVLEIRPVEELAVRVDGAQTGKTGTKPSFSQAMASLALE